MRLNEFKSSRTDKRRKRVGRGISAGGGKTCGRGMKGQRARGQVPVGFEGGQTPLYRRVPKLRGQSKTAMPIGPFRKEYAALNVGQLERFQVDAEVTPEFLLSHRVIRKLGDGVRILGEGVLTKSLTVKAHHFSTSAKEKIEAAGGTCELI